MSSALTGASQAGASSDPALDATMRSEARSLSAFFVMRKLQPFQQRVEAARKAEFAAAAATRAAQRALVEEEEGCGLKRRKVEERSSCSLIQTSTAAINTVHSALAVNQVATFADFCVRILVDFQSTFKFF